MGIRYPLLHITHRTTPPPHRGTCIRLQSAHVNDKSRTENVKPRTVCLVEAKICWRWHMLEVAYVVVVVSWTKDKLGDGLGWDRFLLLAKTRVANGYNCTQQPKDTQTGNLTTFQCPMSNVLCPMSSGGTRCIIGKLRRSSVKLHARTFENGKNSTDVSFCCYQLDIANTRALRVDDFTSLMFPVDDEGAV